MDRVFAKNAKLSPPITPSASEISKGYPGVGGVGEELTQVGEWWFHMMTEEIRNVIVAASITPEFTKLDQLILSINALIAAAIKKAFDAYSPPVPPDNSVPIGMFLFGSMASAPSGYLLCNGASLLVSQYNALFKVLSNKFGGNGVTTFSLPDARGVFLRGLDSGRGLDANRVLGSLQNDAIRNIVGTTSIFDDVAYMKAPPTGAFYALPTVGYDADSDQDNLGARPLGFDASRVVPTAADNRPYNLAFPLYIRAY